MVVVVGAWKGFLGMGLGRIDLVLLLVHAVNICMLSSRKAKVGLFS